MLFLDDLAEMDLSEVQSVGLIDFNKLNREL